MPVLITQRITQRTCYGRICRTLVNQVTGVIRLEVNVTDCKISVLVDKGRQTILVQALEVHREQ